MIEDVEGTEKTESLQFHVNNERYEMAVKILLLNLVSILLVNFLFLYSIWGIREVLQGIQLM